MITYFQQLQFYSNTYLKGQHLSCFQMAFDSLQTELQGRIKMSLKRPPPSVLINEKEQIWTSKVFSTALHSGAWKRGRKLPNALLGDQVINRKKLSIYKSVYRIL